MVLLARHALSYVMIIAVFMPMLGQMC